MENMRGSLFMVMAMAAFAVEDMFIKAAATEAAIGVVLTLFGLGGTLIFMMLTWRSGSSVLTRAMWSRAILIRSLCEMTGRVCFALAIALTPLSSASAILQASPLVVILGAAVIFGERVGMQRWLAIAVGFAGVLMIIRPGLEGFNPASLFAVISTLGFAGRDLATRAAPPALSNFQLGVCGFLVLIPSGILLQLVSGQALALDGWKMAPATAAQVLAAVLFGVAAYNALTIAMRTGEISVVTPFRYTRLLFALVLGMLVFHEQPNVMTVLGSVLIVGSGAYTLLQSRRLVAVSPSR
ncbi:DMT family transporter [Oceanimonas sp. NS1]|nr:DMT family transporter [Oceanimonas sp. NS1]